MRIRSVRHKGLKKFIQTGDTSGIRSADAEKLVHILIELICVPLPLLKRSRQIHEILEKRNHKLSNRKYAISVSASWRLVFIQDGETGDIIDLDYVQYH